MMLISQTGVKDMTILGRPFIKRLALCYPTVVLSCLSVLSVTLVYCGQTVGLIKVKLGVQVGLSSGHIVLDGDPPPLPLLWPNGWMDQDATWYGGRTRPRQPCVRWAPSPPPQYSAHVHCGQMAGLIKMPLGTEVNRSPRNVVLDAVAAPPPQKKGTAPEFLVHVYCG